MVRMMTFTIDSHLFTKMLLCTAAAEELNLRPAGASSAPVWPCIHITADQPHQKAKPP